VLLPVLFSVAPWLAPEFFRDEAFHRWAVAVAVPLSAVGIGIGFRHHRRVPLVLLACAGLLAMMAGALLAADGPTETAVTVAGATAVAAAHLRNWQLGRLRT
jgi:hypothetical protein